MGKERERGGGGGIEGRKGKKKKKEKMYWYEDASRACTVDDSIELTIVLPAAHRKVPSKNLLIFRHQVSCHTHSTTLSLGAVCRPDLEPFCHLISNLALTP